MSEVTLAASTERLALLRECPLFSTLTLQELHDLAATSDHVALAEGDVLFRQGEPGQHLYCVVSGCVRLGVTSPSGLDQPIALMGPSSSFGEMAVLDDEPRSATAVAARPTELLRVGRDALEELMRHHPDAREKFLRQGVQLVSSRLRDANARYWAVAGQSLRAKADHSQHRSRLISLVSHEFRTPLTIVKNSAQRLRLTKGPVESLVKKIELQCGRLEHLVEDLLTLSLLQASSGVQAMAEIDLREVAAEVAAAMAAQARAKGIRLGVAAEGEALFVCDRSLLNRALRHLVDNAIKFSPASGEVRVEVEAAGNGRFRLSVRDQGSGIERTELDRLSLSFVQEQDPLNRNVEGLGIGLALAGEVARAHGGKLLVDSSPGWGSCFTMELSHHQKEERSK